MIFRIEDVTVYFPYEEIYPEQRQYMVELKRTLDAKGHCLLEMSTVSGKIIALLSLIISYIHSKPQSPLKLIYCTQTVHDMEEILDELRLLHDYMVESIGPAAKMLGLGLSSRKNLCINDHVLAAENPSVDAGCRRLTASWVREVAADNLDVPSCEFFEEYQRAGSAAVLPPGVYTLQDLRMFGEEKGWCPYFLARHMMQFANVVVCNYHQYLLDPKLASIVSKQMQKESVVVFDEAHNIDNVCINSLSVSMRVQTVTGAKSNITRMRQKIKKVMATDASRLRDEYNTLVEGLRGDLPATDVWHANPALPDDIPKEAVPEHICKAEDFMQVLQRLVEYLEERMETEQPERENPFDFAVSIFKKAEIDQKTLKFCYDRLHSLMMTLKITDTDEFLHIQTICNFATLVGTYSPGFSIIIEPCDEAMPDIHDPVLQLCCHDASLAIKPVFERFQSVVITSGTLSPINLYPRLLKFSPVVSRSFKISVPRDCICPMVLTHGSDQLPVSTKFDMKSDHGVLSNYGKILLNMSSYVPDGIVCFFPSYLYMGDIVSSWNASGVLNEIEQNKPIFYETQDLEETRLTLANYRNACNSGKGAIFLSVAGGKVAEHIDFYHHYGRLVIIYGVPYQYTSSRSVLARLGYLSMFCNINGGDYLTFDALRKAAVCVGRVIHSKADYGMMIFADNGYCGYGTLSHLPGWIRSQLDDANLDLSTDMAVNIACEFFEKTAQPYGKTGGGSEIQTLYI
ncbi:general transcription and DNA repair factor IIH helicase subunit XPD-like [Vicia villosa]|uniref:general transcription and DNA repair factor IIH helicase subunit XPD-like n=1 Tax=Vicia villosa TaxID=3911 RepID=UPI00273BD61C|nr:general transcription and DNA repair factor IIH helicase subunit XPD-like [Vicia villosa]XP_058745504.1 general transcription and DNA repair factor IIH helicase subunit XPD-like [Vicia villosa]XP_058745505.1 general transcription and DNA repair factor IIH helicase subunit XPD-like [Vicia villosa]XP_058745507.1 general transcription and DNA repair factor IIH helicase subunit XPD-like [Vicia villosa]